MIAFKLTKNYAFELSTPSFYRGFDDGIDFFNLAITADWFRGDHNPMFQILFVIFNLKLIDLTIHNVNHVGDE